MYAVKESSCVIMGLTPLWVMGLNMPMSGLFAAVPPYVRSFGACLEESQSFVPLFESASVCPFKGHWKLRNLW